ncbi:MAG: hypothetical protein H7039_06355 [Bryobacteraceae bacterium]|nr:hypothetical protein [Bryobacteraceae bacterium]
MKAALRPVRLQVHAVVIVCTDDHWESVQLQFPNTRPGIFRGRQFLSRNWGTKRFVFLRAGESLVALAATTQFGIDRWNPGIILTTSHSPAVDEVCGLNGVPIEPEPITAASLESSVSAALKPVSTPTAEEDEPF